MLNEQQIIDLITHEKLSAEELKKLRNEIEQNPELKKLIGIIDALEHLAKESHFDLTTLSNYVLYSNGDESKKSDIENIIPQIEEHLKSCAKCREEVEFLKTELQDVDEYLEENILSSEIGLEDDKKQLGLSLFQRYQSFKYSFATAASLVILFITLFIVSEITTSTYVKVADDFNYTNISTTRGRNSENFVKAIDQLSQENYDKAIELFRADISDNKNDATIFYTYYILGITELRSAQNDFLGLFDSYDNAKLIKAEENFNEVLRLNTSRVFENINSNTYFFLGQIYLLNEDFSKAKSFLNKAIENNSEYSSEAEKLLNSVG